MINQDTLDKLSRRNIPASSGKPVKTPQARYNTVTTGESVGESNPHPMREQPPGVFGYKGLGYSAEVLQAAFADGGFALDRGEYTQGTVETDQFSEPPPLALEGDFSELRVVVDDNEVGMSSWDNEEDLDGDELRESGSIVDYTKTPEFKAGWDHGMWKLEAKIKTPSAPLQTAPTHPSYRKEKRQRAMTTRGRAKDRSPKRLQTAQSKGPGDHHSVVDRRMLQTASRRRGDTADPITTKSQRVGAFQGDKLSMPHLMDGRSATGAEMGVWGDISNRDVHDSMDKATPNNWAKMSVPSRQKHTLKMRNAFFNASSDGAGFDLKSQTPAVLIPANAAFKNLQPISNNKSQKKIRPGKMTMEEFQEILENDAESVAEEGTLNVKALLTARRSRPVNISRLKRIRGVSPPKCRIPSQYYVYNQGPILHGMDPQNDLKFNKQKGWEGLVFPSPMPSSRAEAACLTRTMELMLEAMNKQQEKKEEAKPDAGVVEIEFKVTEGNGAFLESDIGKGLQGTRPTATSGGLGVGIMTPVGEVREEEDATTAEKESEEKRPSMLDLVHPEAAPATSRIVNILREGACKMGVKEVEAQEGIFQRHIKVPETQGQELDIIDTIFCEAIRQVWVHCDERGAVLERVRRRILEFHNDYKRRFEETQSHHRKTMEDIKNRWEVAEKAQLEAAEKCHEDYGNQIENWEKKFRDLEKKYQDVIEECNGYREELHDTTLKYRELQDKYNQGLPSRKQGADVIVLGGRPSGMQESWMNNLSNLPNKGKMASIQSSLKGLRHARGDSSSHNSGSDLDLGGVSDGEDFFTFQKVTSQSNEETVDLTAMYDEFLVSQKIVGTLSSIKPGKDAEEGGVFAESWINWVINEKTKEFKSHDEKDSKSAEELLENWRKGLISVDRNLPPLEHLKELNLQLQNIWAEWNKLFFKVFEYEKKHPSTVVGAHVMRGDLPSSESEEDAAEPAYATMETEDMKRRAEIYGKAYEKAEKQKKPEEDDDDDHDLYSSRAKFSIQDMEFESESDDEADLAAKKSPAKLKKSRTLPERVENDDQSEESEESDGDIAGNEDGGAAKKTTKKKKKKKRKEKMVRRKSAPVEPPEESQQESGSPMPKKGRRKRISTSQKGDDDKPPPSSKRRSSISRAPSIRHKKSISTELEAKDLDGVGKAIQEEVSASRSPSVVVRKERYSSDDSGTHTDTPTSDLSSHITMSDGLPFIWSSTDSDDTTSVVSWISETGTRKITTKRNAHHRNKLLNRKRRTRRRRGRKQRKKERQEEQLKFERENALPTRMQQTGLNEFEIPLDDMDDLVVAVDKAINKSIDSRLHGEGGLGEQQISRLLYSQGCNASTQTEQWSGSLQASRMPVVNIVKTGNAKAARRAAEERADTPVRDRGLTMDGQVASGSELQREIAAHQSTMSAPPEDEFTAIRREQKPGLLVKVGNINLLVPGNWIKYNKAPNPRLMSNRYARGLVYHIFSEKFKADDVDIRQGTPIMPLPEYTVTYFLFEFGVKKIVNERMASFLYTIKKTFLQERRLRLFARFCNMLDPIPMDGLSFYLGCFSKLELRFITNKHMRTMVELSHAQRVLKQTFQEMFMNVPDKVNNGLKDMSFREQEYKNKDLVDMDDLSELIVDEWQIEYERVKASLKSLYEDLDTDSSGSLGFDEFKKATDDCATTQNIVVELKQIKRMYIQAVENSLPDCPEIDLNGFVHACLRHRQIFYRYIQPIPDELDIDRWAITENIWKVEFKDQGFIGTMEARHTLQFNAIRILDKWDSIIERWRTAKPSLIEKLYIISGGQEAGHEGADRIRVMMYDVDRLIFDAHTKIKEKADRPRVSRIVSVLVANVFNECNSLLSKNPKALKVIRVIRRLKLRLKMIRLRIRKRRDAELEKLREEQERLRQEERAESMLGALASGFGGDKPKLQVDVGKDGNPETTPARTSQKSLNTPGASPPKGSLVGLLGAKRLAKNLKAKTAAANKGKAKKSPVKKNQIQLPEGSPKQEEPSNATTTEPVDPSYPPLPVKDTPVEAHTKQMMGQWDHMMSETNKRS